MKLHNQTILKLFFLSCFIILYVPVISQENLNKSKDLGMELQSYAVNSFWELNVNLTYSQRQKTYFAGAGFSKHFNYNILEPVFILGYRKYPGKKSKPLKFYYQTFLYYSSAHNRDTHELSNRYITANFGVGFDYNFAKNFSVGLNTNVGWGPDFVKKSGSITLIPLQLSISYK